MNLPKRTIRKSNITRHEGFDSQFWPIVVALCVLGGVSLGSLMTFLTGAWLWVSLLGLPLVLALGIFCFSLIDNRKVRRSLQLGFLVSLICHLLMMTGSFYTVIFGSPSRTAATRPKTIQRKTIRRPVDFPTQTWTDVNPVELPDPDEIEAEPETQSHQSPQRPQPTPVEDPTPTVDPNLVRRPESVQTTPRQQESLSRMSRQTDRDLPTSSSSADVASQSSSNSAPELTVQGQSNLPRQSASSTQERTSQQVESTASLAANAQRRESNAPSESSNAAASPTDRQRNTTTQANTTAQADRPQSVPTPATTPVTPAVELPRQNNSAIAGRQSAPEAESTTASSQVNPRRASAEAPAMEQIAQSNASAPNRVRQTVRPDLSDPVETADASQTPNPVLVAEATTRQTTRSASESTTQAQRQNRNAAAVDPAAQLAQATRREAITADASAASAAGGVPQRRRSSREIEIDTAAANPQKIAAQQPSLQNQASPQASDVARRVTQVTANRQTSPSPDTSQSQNALATRASRSETPAAEASINPARKTAEASRRSIALTPQTQSPTAVETPAIAPSGQGQSSQRAEPRPLALSQSTTGSAGGRQSRNLENDTAAGERPAVEASTTARRERTTSRDAETQALAPSQFAQAGRNRAQASAPNATLRAETDAHSSLAGTEQPSLEATTASASLSESASDVAQTDVSALKGTGEVDLGPPKIVAENMSGRGSGGGQPTLSNAASPLADGQASRAAQRASLASSAKADLPSSPLNDGGGTPDLLADSPDAQSLRVADAAGSSDAARSPTPGELSDSTSLELASTETGPPSLSRATRATTGRDALEAEANPAATNPLGRRSADGAALLSQSSADISGMAGESDEDEDEEDDEAAAVEGLASTLASDRVGGVSGRTGSTDLEMAVAESGGAAERSGLERQGRRESATAALGGLALGGGSRRAPAAVAATAQADIGAEISQGSTSVTEGMDSIDPNEAGPSAQIAAGSQGSESSRSQIEMATGSVSTGATAGVAGSGRRRASSEATGDSAGLEQLANSRRSRVRTLASTESGVNLGELADQGGMSGVEVEAGSGNQSGVGDTSIAQRAAAGGVRVEMEADTGPGGLEQNYSSAAGINDRRAKPDTGPLQAFVETRFERQRAGGLPTLNTAAAVASEAFKDRERQRSQRKGAPQTELTIENGLEFLARFQEVDGRWRLERFGNGRGDATDETPLTQSDTAATGLAILAFQGAGYNHVEYKYADPLKRAVDWLVAHQSDDGGLYVETQTSSSQYAKLYSHAIAALALCEAYGVTQDPALLEPAQKAIDYIVASQDKTRGGWRYTPERGADTSVSGWMMMALKSGQLANLDVDAGTYQRISRWLRDAADPDRRGHFRYNPQAPNTAEQGHGRVVSRSMTAVGLLMSLYLGGNRRDADFQAGVDYLLEQLPSDENAIVRDTYYWYYATQVLRHMDGEAWQQWKSRLVPLLRSSQINQGEYAGSWDPLGPVPDRWSAHGGRIYLTAMNLLSLEVDYRLLPLYVDTVR